MWWNEAAFCLGLSVDNSLLFFYKNLFKIYLLCEKAMCCLSDGTSLHEKYASLKKGAVP
jgi:hypothetical protein